MSDSVDSDVVRDEKSEVNGSGNQGREDIADIAGGIAMEELKHIVGNLLDALRTLKISAKELYDLWVDTQEVTVNVLGDPITDRYVYVECTGIAKGYPILKWKKTGQIEYDGGCLKVGRDCRKQCKIVNIECVQQLISSVTKIRYMYNNTQIFRTDIDDTYTSYYPDEVNRADVTILSLFGGKYPIEPNKLLRLAGNSHICIDSQNPANIRKYKSDRKILFATDEEFEASGCRFGDFRTVFIKDGTEGSSVNGTSIPALNKKPVDDVGAGDAYLATAAIMIGKYGDKYVEAALMGSISAALHCAQYGNITITREMIDDVLVQAIG